MASKKWLLDSIKESAKSTGRVLPIVSVQASRENHDKQKNRDTEHLHPSEISKKRWCPRSSWYTIKGYPQPPQSSNFQRLNVFAEGNAIHNKWQTWLWEAGSLIGNWKCINCGHTWYGKSHTKVTPCASCGSVGTTVYREVSISSEEYRIIGHADGLVEDKNGQFLLEVKSVGAGTIRYESPDLFVLYSKGQIDIDELWNRIRSPFPSHLRQANLYMMCTGVHSLSFIYEWKPTQAVKEFVVQYQPELIDDVLKGCKTVIEHLELNKPPKKPVWVSGPSDQTCKYCPYNKECWGDDEDC